MRQSSILFLCFLLSGTLLFAGANEEITSIVKEQEAAWNRGDLDGFMKPYDSSPQLVFMSSNGPIRNAQAVKDRYEKNYEKTDKDFGKLTFSNLEIEELSQDVARAWGKYLVEQKESKPVSGWFTLILKKTGNTWKIIHDHSS
jgi:ketosteroid isomerase-like protein